MRVCIGISLLLLLTISYYNDLKSHQDSYYIEEPTRAALNNMHDSFAKKMRSHMKRNNLIKGLRGLMARRENAQGVIRKHLSAAEVEEGSSIDEIEEEEV